MFKKFKKMSTPHQLKESDTFLAVPAWNASANTIHQRAQDLELMIHTPTNCLVSEGVLREREVVISRVTLTMQEPSTRVSGTCEINDQQYKSIPSLLVWRNPGNTMSPYQYHDSKSLPWIQVYIKSPSLGSYHVYLQ